MVGPFGLRPKSTMSARALPMAQALVARGHQVTVLIPPWDWPVDSGKVWVDRGVTVENVALSPAPLLGRVLIVWRLLRRVLALRPDVVHCFKPKAYAGLTAWALWWLRKLRLIRVRLVVDSDDWEGFGGWNDLESYSWLQKRVFAWQERWGLRRGDALTLASKALETIVWSMGVPPERVYYVPNGSGGARTWERRGAPDEAAHPTVLLYTRFFEFQLERVVQVFRQIYQSKPETRFLIVGKGLFGEETRFVELCRAAGLQDAVEDVGWVDGEALPRYLAQADVAVYPFDDTLVNRAKCAAKLRDLMAAGVPVVAEAVGQNVVYITHNVSGLLAPPGDAASMARLAVMALDDAALRRRLSEGAQRYIRDNLTWDILAERVEAAYLTVG